MRDLRESLKNHINTGDFELSGILEKIDILWMEGSLTDDERAEFKEQARGKAPMEKGYAGYDERFRRIEERLEELEKNAAADGEAAIGAEEYPAWVQPTGAHDAYYTGQKMTWTDGKQYICTAPDGYGVAYGPDVLPGYWKEAMQ